MGQIVPDLTILPRQGEMSPTTTDGADTEQTLASYALCQVNACPPCGGRYEDALFPVILTKVRIQSQQGYRLKP
ncbi:hypothetical protein HMP09_1004 [Sphingomonas sp. HMP9]|nr:hypothetical protein HMP09_1004 [Sphingomonas sp. HMP9]